MGKNLDAWRAMTPEEREAALEPKRPGRGAPPRVIPGRVGFERTPPKKPISAGQAAWRARMDVRYGRATTSHWELGEGEEAA